jgi:hypothetical protein
MVSIALKNRIQEISRKNRSKILFCNEIKNFCYDLKDSSHHKAFNKPLKSGFERGEFLQDVFIRKTRLLLASGASFRGLIW